MQRGKKVISILMMIFMIVSFLGLDYYKVNAAESTDLNSDGYSNTLIEVDRDGNSDEPLGLKDSVAGEGESGGGSTNKVESEQNEDNESDSSIVLKVEKVWMDCGFDKQDTEYDVTTVPTVPTVATVGVLIPGTLIVESSFVHPVDRFNFVEADNMFNVNDTSEDKSVDEKYVEQIGDYKITGRKLEEKEIPVEKVVVKLYVEGEDREKTLELELNKGNNWMGEFELDETYLDENGWLKPLKIEEVGENIIFDSKYEDFLYEQGGEISLNGEEFKFWSIVDTHSTTDVDKRIFESKIFNYRESCKSEPDKPKGDYPYQPELEEPYEPEDEDPDKPGLVEPYKPELEEPYQPRERELEKVEEKNPNKVSESNSEELNIESKLDLDNHFKYIQGYKDGTIRPDDNIRREEVAAVFFRLLDEDFKESIRVASHSYSDFPKDRWSSKHIGTLSKGGIIEGYPDNTFRPNGYITRAEVAAIASRFDDLEKTDKSKFKDVKGHWAEEYIDSAEKKGWIKGYSDGTFKPDNLITRAEFITLVNNVLNRKVRKDNILEGIERFIDLDEDSWYYEAIVEATNSHSYQKERLEDSSEIWEKIVYPNLEM